MDNEQTRLTSWLAARRQHVTSTDLPSIMRLDDAFGAPIDVYLDKLGQAERGPLAEWMEWGQLLQRGILTGYARRVERVLDEIDPYDLFEDPACPRLAASLDGRWADGDRRPVDAKLVARMNPQLWGDPFTDQIPQRYAVQLQVQMAVTGTAIADLAVLFGGNRMVIYRVERDDQLLALLREVAQEFWAQHVEARVPPPLDGSAGWTRYLASRPQATALVLESGPEIDRWARGLRAVQAQQKKLAELEDLAKNALRAAIGDHAGLAGPWGRIAYRQNKAKNVLDKDAYIEALEEWIRNEDHSPDTPAGLKALRDSLTTTKPGDRPLRPTWAEEDVTLDADVLQLVALERPALPPKESA
jgi:putative phage-type endonuclease